jgi:hypothetical protein
MWRTLSALLIILFITAVYLYIFPTLTLIYIAVVLLHAGLATRNFGWHADHSYVQHDRTIVNLKTAGDEEAG